MVARPYTVTDTNLYVFDHELARYSHDLLAALLDLPVAGARFLLQTRTVQYFDMAAGLADQALRLQRVGDVKKGWCTGAAIQEFIAAPDR